MDVLPRILAHAWRSPADRLIGKFATLPGARRGPWYEQRLPIRPSDRIRENRLGLNFFPGRPGRMPTGPRCAFSRRWTFLNVAVPA